jgi:hypothetical protein
VRRAVKVLLLALILVGCQGSDTGFYDEQAKDAALRAAKNAQFGGDGVVVSVESVEERDECPQAPSPQAGPCLNVTVAQKFPARDLSGKEVGLKVQTAWDFFVWLEKRDNGHWQVTHTSHRPKGVAVNGQAYIPNQ